MADLSLTKYNAFFRFFFLSVLFRTGFFVRFLWTQKNSKESCQVSVKYFTSKHPWIFRIHILLHEEIFSDGVQRNYEIGTLKYFSNKRKDSDIVLDQLSVKPPKHAMDAFCLYFTLSVNQESCFLRDLYSWYLFLHYILIYK